MSTVKAEIEINAPPERVWETIMNPDCLGEWVTIHKSVRNVSDPPLREGSTMDQSMVIRGVTFRVHWTLVSVTSPSYAEWEGSGPARSRARITYALEAGKDGGTRFEYTNEFHPPGGRLGNMAGRVVVGGASQREANNSLSRLKALLEKDS